MSERKFKLPNLKDLKKKREKMEEQAPKRARRAGALSVPETVGEQKTVRSREPRRQDNRRDDEPPTAPSPVPGVISSVPIAPGDRKDRPLEVPERVRARYGRGRDAHRE